MAPSLGFPDSSVGKESACNEGDPGSISGLERSTGEGIGYPLQYSWASLVASLVKNLPAMKENWDRPLGWEDPLEKGKASHSSILAWRTVHGVTKSRKQLSDFTFFTFFCWVIWGTGHLEYWRHVSTSQFLKIRWPVFLLPGCPHTPQKKKFYSPPWHLENKKHSPIALCCKSYSSARALLWGFPCLPSTCAVGTGKVQRAPPCKYDSGFADKWGWQEPM